MTHSIRKRFFFTVGTNLFRGLLTFVTGMLLARWLGPQSYGNMAFLLGTFIGFRALLDMGTSSAFFTFLSQKPRSRSFVLGFFGWMGIQFLVPTIFIGLLFPDRWIETIWQGESTGLILLAFAAAFLQYSVWPVVQQAGESQRQTIRVQGIGLIVAGAHLLAVALLWLLGVLGLYALFAAIILEYLLASVVAHQCFPYAREGSANTPNLRQESTLQKYWRYCLPLIPYSFVSFAYEFADRWLLQKFGGGVEQAFYAVSAQFAGVALIATSSILRIFWKEIAEAHHKGDHDRTGRLYQKVSRLLFLIGALIAGYLIPWAEEVMQLVLGTAYAGGATTLAIMFLFPVHQSMGQIGSTMLLATEQVRLQVITGIVFMTASIGVTYFILASPQAEIPGLGLASEGLAWKMVGMQILSVNVIAYLIARLWKWPFDWVYQPVSLLGCVGIGAISAMASTWLTGTGWSTVVIPMIVGGIFYLLSAIVFVYNMPWLAGLTREELKEDVKKVWQSATKIWG